MKKASDEIAKKWAEAAKYPHGRPATKPNPFLEALKRMRDRHDETLADRESERQERERYGYED